VDMAKLVPCNLKSSYQNKEVKCGIPVTHNRSWHTMQLKDIMHVKEATLAAE